METLFGRLTAGLLAALALALAPAAALQPPPAFPEQQFPRGLSGPTPVQKAIAVPRMPAAAPAPPQFAVVPSRLSVWGNNKYGCCVTSQEAFSLAAWSTRCLGPDREVFVPEDVMVAWARKYNLLNGAYLTQVMDLMAKYGMAVDGVTYKDGSYYSVDFTNPTELQAALYVGPVNIAIDADALNGSGAGSRKGWYAAGKSRYSSPNHCVALTAYGPAGFLYQQLGVPLPAAVPADRAGYLLFTWGTIGFVDHDWLASTCTEAYVRNPTTVGMAPPTPTPPTPPTPPMPPGPTPPPGPAGDFVTTTVKVYKGGVLVSETTTLGAPPATDPPAAADLAAAGINPAVFADALQLLADLRAKPVDRAKVKADFFRLLADFLAGG